MDNFAIAFQYSLGVTCGICVGILILALLAPILNSLAKKS